MRIFILILMAGCGGELRDPERFTLSSDGGSGCDAPATVLKPKCTQGACHSNDSPAAHLDLLSSGAGMRMRDVAALGCGGGKLIDSASPADSVLLERLDSSSCGSAMPPTSPLSQSERACLTAWVNAVAAP